MNIYYIIGIGFILFTIVDLMWTTFWVDGGAGWLTDNLTTIVWKIIKRIDRELFYNLAGPLILALTLFNWVFLLWVGATIFFAGNPEALVNSSTNQAISGFELFYYSGFTLFTLGVGDFTAQTLLFKIATVLISGIGMLLLTFSASYIISVVGAVVLKRSFARSVMGLGETSLEFLENVWNGESFSQLDLMLNSMNTQITELSQQTQAFPLVQYYHSEEIEKTATVAIAVLDDVLTVLRYGLKDKSIVNMSLVMGSQSSIATYLNTSINGYGNQVKGIHEVPEPVHLEMLNHTNIPLVNQAEYLENIEHLNEHRNKLLTIIRIDNHEWPNNFDNGTD